MTDFAPGLLIMRKTPDDREWDPASKPRMLISIVRQQTNYTDEYRCHFLIIEAGGTRIDSWVFRPYEYDRNHPELPTINERTGKVVHSTLSWDWYVIGTGQEAYRKGHI